MFLYMNNKQSKREIKKSIPFTIALKIFLLTNLIKVVKDLHAETYKTYKKLMTTWKIIERYSLFMNEKNPYY